MYRLTDPPTTTDAVSSCIIDRRRAVVVHNNWIIGKAAKVYRFKEHLMWTHDGPGRYYTSQTNRYLLYRSVPAPPRTSSANSSAPFESELFELRAALALGHLLRRVVILPRFHCGRPTGGGDVEECPLNSIISVADFDAEFAGQYRENSFPLNRRVPEPVRIELMRAASGGSSSSSGVVDFAAQRRPNRRQNGSGGCRIGEAEALELFGGLSELQVVVVVTGLRDCDVEISDRDTFDRRFRRATRSCDYRQYHCATW